MLLIGADSLRNIEFSRVELVKPWRSSLTTTYLKIAVCVSPLFAKGTFAYACKPQAADELVSPFVYS